MKDRVQEVIAQMEKVLDKGGYLPRELTFNGDVSIRPHREIDVDNINFEPWKTLDFWEQRMPEGLLEQFPCLYFMVEEMLEKNKDNNPLKELEQRRRMAEEKISIIDDEDDKLMQINNDDACRQMNQLMKDHHKETYHEQMQYEIERLEELIKLHKRTEPFFTGLNLNYCDELSAKIEELKDELHA